MATTISPSTLAVIRQSPLLASCTGTEVDHVIAASSEQVLEQDAYLFTEKDRVDSVWILVDGELAISKNMEGEELFEQALPGAFLGEIPLLMQSEAHVGVRAVVPSRLLRIPDQTFRELIASCPSVAATVVRTLVDRVRRFQAMVQEREKLAGLGTIAAGLAHELNNPAAAANRAATQAEEMMDELRALGRKVITRRWSEEEMNFVQALDTDASHADDIRAEISALDPLARSDREDALATWLDAHGVKDAWESAPGLVAVGMTPERLSELANGIALDSMQQGLIWVERRAALRQLLAEVRASTGRISELVAAVKAYSHADTVTPKVTDVHFALENTLTMFVYKLRSANIEVQRHYDRSTPKISTFGSELHQVWTNLIDNAIDSISCDEGRTPSGGTIRIETMRDGDIARVDIVDNGPGIPADLLPKIFDPFFTTKDVGKGTGLGLEIVQRIALHHGGTVSVESKPGETRFTVRLPLAPSPGGSK